MDSKKLVGMMWLITVVCWGGYASVKENHRKIEEAAIESGVPRVEALKGSRQFQDVLGNIAGVVTGITFIMTVSLWLSRNVQRPVDPDGRMPLPKEPDSRLR